MTSTILSTILQLVLTLATPFALFLFYMLLNLLEKKFNIQLTDAQRQVVYGAINTGAGLLENSLQKGTLKVEDLTVDNPKVQAITAVAMKNVQESAQALTVSPDVATRMVISAHARLVRNNL